MDSPSQSPTLAFELLNVFPYPLLLVECANQNDTRLAYAERGASLLNTSKSCNMPNSI